jgi:hypothetical protein
MGLDGTADLGLTQFVGLRGSPPFEGLWKVWLHFGFCIKHILYLISYKALYSRLVQD